MGIVEDHTNITLVHILSEDITILDFERSLLTVAIFIFVFFLKFLLIVLRDYIAFRLRPVP